MTLLSTYCIRLHNLHALMFDKTRQAGEIAHCHSNKDLKTRCALSTTLAKLLIAQLAAEGPATSESLISNTVKRRHNQRSHFSKRFMLLIICLRRHEHTLTYVNTGGLPRPPIHVVDVCGASLGCPGPPLLLMDVCGASRSQTR